MKTYRRIAPLALCIVAFVFVGSARAATVVNGDFETGTLQGWLTTNETASGEWSVVSGTESPLSGRPIAAPFSGSYDAVTDEDNPSAMVLYQDIALPAGETHELSLELNYRSQAPIAIPTPDTLDVEGTEGGGIPQADQQVRVDVMKAGSPVSSLSPADILATVFATKEGDPVEIGWTHLTANLSAFAGQTVRLRVAVTDNQNFLFAGVDAVTINSTAPPSIAPPVTNPPPAAPTPQCVVPKLKGEKLKAAKRALTAAQCKIGAVKKRAGATAKTGKVVKQSRPPGTTLPIGTKVTLTIRP